MKLPTRFLLLLALVVSLFAVASARPLPPKEKESNPVKISAKVQISSPLLASPTATRRVLERVVAEQTFGLERDIKESLQTPKHGRIYRRGAIRSRQVFGVDRKRLGSLGTRKSLRLNSFGSRFHRASARGEAPATDAGNLLNSIRATPKGLRGRLIVNAIYGAILENQLNRPFVAPAVDRRRILLQRAADAAVKSLT